MRDSVWKLMASAPTDGRPILAVCRHPARTTDRRIYAGWLQELGSLSLDGIHVIQFGGGFCDDPDDGGANMPDWWFLSSSAYEIPVNPIAWTEIPEWTNNAPEGCPR